MKAKTAFTTLVLTGFVTAGSWAQNNPKGNDKDKTAAESQPTATVPPASQEPASAAPVGYVIGPEDTLHVSVWKEPDLSATLPVRPDGMISLPLLNDVQAAGLTPMQLRDSITSKLKKYLADPRVTVVVTAINSQRIYVTGEVLHTGPVTLVPDMTVLQALSSAGFTQFANTKKIYVLRMESGKQQKMPVNYKELLQGNPATNILLKPGDTIVVP
jgi:polysaccharide biosynthesis/export protein